jgi:hypothetical protein
MNDQDMIENVAVPRKYLGPVYQLLGELMTGEAEAAGAQLEVKVDAKGWGADALRLLQPDVRGAARSMMDLTADRPGTWVALDEIEQAADRSHFEARADLAGFTKLVRRLFGRDRWWPVDVKWNMGPKHQLYYRASPEVARWWKEASAS